MLQVAVFLLYFSSFTTLCGAEDYYCVVDANSSGIITLEPHKGKNSAYVEIESKYLDYESEVLNFTSQPIKRYQILDSLYNKSLINQPVLDQRWENFINNRQNPLHVQKFLATPNLTVFFSVRTSEGQWHQLMANDSKLYSCKRTTCTDLLNPEGNNLHFYFLKYSSTSFWKVHNYRYLYTTEKTYVQIYERCATPIKEGCIYIHLAMCKGCIIELHVNSRSKSFITHFSGTNSWQTEQIPLLAYFPDRCFTISVETKTKNVTGLPFWAIGDIAHISSKYTCEENKRYIPITKEVGSEIVCENASSYKINFTSELRLPVKKIEESASSFNLLWLTVTILIVSIIIIIISYAVYKKKRRQLVENKDEGEENTELANFRDELLFTEKKRLSFWPAIKTADFDKYVQRVCSLNNNENLHHQFSNLPSGSRKKCTKGTKKKNVRKNKFPNILPYDDNRVKLKERKSGSYINASYIQGVNSYKEYIATQNPLENTVEDFWDMVWQKKVDHIVMVTSTDEAFYQYWPEGHTLSVIYGEIEIDLDNIVNYEFYTYRVFRVRKKGVVRQVDQLHYHSWDSENLTSLSHTFVDFIGQILKIPRLSAPIVIHCVSGVGRSGTILLCDIVLRTLPITGTIDMYSTTKGLRKCRANMVSTLEQYMVAHFIVRDILRKDM